jgi:molybdopterin molybdotransferase
VIATVGRTTFLRVQVELAPDGRYHVRSAGGQGSHQLSAMARAGGLAVVAPGARVAAGDTAAVLLLGA